MITKDQTAYPANGTWEHKQGLTKREHFAALAMQGMLAACDGFDASKPFIEFVAASAVDQADALIEALNKQ